MRSKWEYIRDACKELGYEEAAGIADEIETVLKEIYGDTRTIAWMRDYIDIKNGDCFMSSRLSDIYLVTVDIVYCIACDKDGCSSCRFRKRSGGCASGTALFGRFIEALRIAERRE